jgi:hypothetical protein
MNKPLLNALLAFVVTCLSLRPPIQAQEKNLGGSEQSLRKEYSDLGDDWRAQRAFCMRMIDDGLIATRKVRLSEILPVFGADAMIVTGNPNVEGTAFVLFDVQAPPNADEGRAYGFRGWYLCVKSNKAGRIVNYYFSNIHKGISGG